MVGRAGASKDAPGHVRPVTPTLYVSPPLWLASQWWVFKIRTWGCHYGNHPYPTHPKIDVIHGKAVTSSLAVANISASSTKTLFKKSRRLSALWIHWAEFSAQWLHRLHRPQIPCYQITRDGFAFLAMGFTGNVQPGSKRHTSTPLTWWRRVIRCRCVWYVSCRTKRQRRILHLREIHQIWTSQLYPMLKALNLRWLANCTTVLVMLFLGPTCWLQT